MLSEPKPERLVNAAMLRENVETNLADSALEQLIDDADAAVVGYCGPHNQDGPFEEILPGGSSRLFPSRAVESVDKVTETVGTVSTDLSPDDYRSWYGGRMLERLSNGPHALPYWGGRVLLRYTPVSTDAQRRMAIIRLVQLGIQYSGVQSERVGPYSSQSLDYTRERDAILKQLCAGTPI